MAINKAHLTNVQLIMPPLILGKIFVFLSNGISIFINNKKDFLYFQNHVKLVKKLSFKTFFTINPNHVSFGVKYGKGASVTP